MANMLIDVADDRSSATARSYVQVLHGLAGHPIATIATAFYDDRYVRIDGRWRFESRVATASLVGDMSTHVRRKHAPGRASGRDGDGARRMAEVRSTTP